jgi:hypothetical protein
VEWLRVILHFSICPNDRAKVYTIFRTNTFEPREEAILHRDYWQVSVAISVLAFAFLMTTFSFLALKYEPISPLFGSVPSPGTWTAMIMYDNRAGVYVATVFSWIGAGAMGAWIWRGRTRIAWTETGFNKDVFHLLMKMKGGNSRLKVMNALDRRPKDRLQLSNELEMDWKTIDRHVKILSEYGLVREEASHGWGSSLPF